MNFLDIVLFIIIFALSIYGLIRGFVKEIVSIISIVLGLNIALHWYEEAARYLSFLNNQNQQNILGFIIVFIGVSLLLSILGKLVSLVLKSINLGCLDHLLGLVLGFVKGVVVACVILLVLVSFLPPSNKVLAGSQLAPSIISITKTIVVLAPSGFKEQFMVNLDKLHKVWGNGSGINTLLKALREQFTATPTTTINPDNSKRK
jgi:membrane protein required for colicin V production